MTRFSLSPTNDDWDEEGQDRNSPAKFALLRNNKSYRGVVVVDDHDDDEVEEAHPLGFGRTRYSLRDSDWESVEHYKRRYGYAFPYETNDHSSFQARGHLSPIVASASETTPATSLLRRLSTDDRTMDRLTKLLQSAALVAVGTGPSIPPIGSVTTSTNAWASPAEDQARIRQEIDQYKLRIENDNLQAAKALEKLIEREEMKAAKVMEQRRMQQEREELEIAREAQEAETRHRAAQEEEMENVRRLKEAKAAEKAKQQEEEAQKAKKKEFLHRARKLVAQLVQLRESVEPFERSQTVGKRRLAMKKIVNGKVNTLSENVEKIKAVAQEVCEAIATARVEDENMKQQLQAGAPGITSEMTRGKRYFIDLLCSKVIVRAQAEGFDGVQGHGFPLASMLAHISVENKDLNPVLAAHIYTVCPIAIPSLPESSHEASEEQLMENLGMLRDKEGNFETFDRFLDRTESVIALVADIMSSQPSQHVLMDGHEGAVNWLKRFLDLLPDPPHSPLPIITAPVLDAFLSRAGHMLANIHANEFRILLDRILTKVINRLDEGPIGKPSAIRLKKTIEGGFNEFANNLPKRALSSLYYGSTASDPTVGGSHGNPPSSRSTTFEPSISGGTNPFGQRNPESVANLSSANSMNTGPSSIFPNASSGVSPFGTVSAAPTPFGTVAGAPTPFGTVAGAPTPFGTIAGAPTPFGTIAGTPTPFGTISSQGQTAQVNTSTSAPVGSVGAPSPFGSTGSNTQVFGQGSFSSATTPFGVASGLSSFPGGMIAPSSSPFISNNVGSTSFGNSTSSLTQFGDKVNNNPFSKTSSPSPFGGQFATTNPFGQKRQNTQFDQVGSGAQQQHLSGDKPVCKYFQQGRCRYGNNCNFSHTLPNDDRGGNAGNPFGARRR